MVGCGERARAGSIRGSVVSVQSQSSTYGIGRARDAGGDWRLGRQHRSEWRRAATGQGNGSRRQDVYERRCARCHGLTGTEGPDSGLVGGVDTLASERPLKTVGSYWPFATTLWDYTNRAMPFDQPGSLTPDEVYGVVAYVLFLNEIIGKMTRSTRRACHASHAEPRRVHRRPAA